MKTGTIAVSVAALIMAGGIAYSFLKNKGEASAESVAATKSEEASGEFVHVDDLAKNPEAFDGDITLRAVVSGVNEDEKAFAVIDSREFEACGVTTCAENIVPVVFDGKLPTPKSLVMVKGHISDGDKGLVFRAASLQVVQ